MSPARSHPPSVEHVLVAARRLSSDGTDPDALATVAREVVADERDRMDRGAEPSTIETLAEEVVERIETFADPAGSGSGLTSTLNATGVILHTNLGRAPWPQVAIAAAERAAGTYSLLELDRGDGRRGPRFRVAETHLIALTGAQDALVTVNNAAAVALAVGLAGKHGVAVSRGELVEIGGGVRIPEIIRRTGARLVEVGTTNRTRAADFEAPLADGLATVVLRVHPSNFAQAGFVEAPDPADVAATAHRHGAIVVDDLGSGALLDTTRFGLAHEPTPAERLAAGADLVTFSGDKLIGGPQAGLIVGRSDLIVRLRKDPFARAVRPEKVILAALAATLGLYRAGRAVSEIPVWRMIAATPEGLRPRAEAIVASLASSLAVDEADRVSISDTVATIGGGSLPGETLPSVGLRIVGRAPSALMARLRGGQPVVIARVERGAVILDLRTLDQADDVRLAEALVRALHQS
jgi:L-seryl-tRNA(Ser) seleniumtransferase